MINNSRVAQHQKYDVARNHLIANPSILIELEKFLTDKIISIIRGSLTEIKEDYNEASILFPFWENYPPEDRGRQPIADQYPWIEVGEHAIGSKLPRLLIHDFSVRDCGLPSGADERFVLTSNSILNITNGLTDTVWLFIDIKSIGPRDDQSHTVMSHNQVSGSGEWPSPNTGVRNGILTAAGPRASHDFHASMPPLFVLSNGKVAPLVIMALKPVYSMLPATTGYRNSGQPLTRIDLACIPNGLLLTQKPNYLSMYPGLLFPGKDDKSKAPTKLRARVSFELLKKIDQWRVQTITVPYP